MSELDELRLRIRQIDDQIVRLIRERMEFASEVGRLKKQRRVPLRDWQVERVVLEHAEGVADRLGVSRSLARSVMQLLMNESRAEQERQTYSNYSGSAECIAVIGGRGKMGRWIADFFCDQGHRVQVYDVAGAAPLPEAARHDSAASLEEALRDASFAVVATPLSIVPRTIEEIASLRYTGIVFDIASLKGHLKDAIAGARSAGVSVTSIHPMFGPATRALSDQVICICDCGDTESTRRVRGFFADTAATLVDLSLDEHDRIASYVLGLSHLTNILFTRVLMKGGDSFAALNRVGSTTFHSQMATTETVMREDPDLYYSIQRLNPFTPPLYDALLEELNALTRAVLENNHQKFSDMMTAGRQWLGHKRTP